MKIHVYSKHIVICYQSIQQGNDIFGIDCWLYFYDDNGFRFITNNIIRHPVVEESLDYINDWVNTSTDSLFYIPRKGYLKQYIPFNQGRTPESNWISSRVRTGESSSIVFIKEVSDYLICIEYVNATIRITPLSNLNKINNTTIPFLGESINFTDISALIMIVMILM